MSNLFNDCNSLEAIDLNYFNTENVEDMSNMFKNCEKLKEIDVSKFKTDKVKNMFGLFENSGVINLDLINFETAIATNMGNMFKDCKYLNLLNLDFNTKNVEYMGNMFSSCISLTSLNISMFDIDDSKDFSNMFENDKGLELYLDMNRCEDLIGSLPYYISVYDSPTIFPIGEINCIYNVKSIATNTILLGKEFSKNSKFYLYVDDEKIKYTKEYKMNRVGSHQIKFVLYEDINMDYMFKDVPDLFSVEMTSNENCQILSMISTLKMLNLWKNFLF